MCSLAMLGAGATNFVALLLWALYYWGCHIYWFVSRTFCHLAVLTWFLICYLYEWEAQPQQMWGKPGGS